MWKLFIFAAIIATIFQYNAHGQEYINTNEINDLAVPAAKPEIETPITDIGKDVNAEQLKNIIEEYGFTSEYITKKIENDRTYDVYKTIFAPGQVGIIATPTDNSKGLFFAQNPYYAQNNIYQNASWIDGDALRNRLIDALMTSVKSACELPVRPSRIAASASVGIISLELEWASAEICDKL